MMLLVKCSTKILNICQAITYTKKLYLPVSEFIIHSSLCHQQIPSKGKAGASMSLLSSQARFDVSKPTEPSKAEGGRWLRHGVGSELTKEERSPE